MIFFKVSILLYRFREMEGLINKYLRLEIDKVIDQDNFNSTFIVQHSIILERLNLRKWKHGSNEGLTAKGFLSCLCILKLHYVKFVG